MANQPRLGVVILAAGLGTRMQSSLPKVMHKVAGRPLLGHALASVTPLSPDQIVVVVGPDSQKIADYVAPHRTATQAERLGTGHAVQAAASAFASFQQRLVASDVEEATILILFGDTPFIQPSTLQQMLDARTAGAALVVLGFEPEDPTGYGRLVCNAEGQLEAIIEHRDADAQTRAIRQCNSGVMAVDARHIWDWLAKVDNNNPKGEYYLTDLVAIARKAGHMASVVTAAEEELLGINSRRDLARAEAIWQTHRRLRALDEGATLTDPQSVWFSWDTELGRDVEIGPNVQFGPGVRVADGVQIKAFCHLEGAEIATGAQIGPFARLRPGAKLDQDAFVGNFVEVKNAHLAAGAKASHLSYIGDAAIGAGANIGAGVITCNYDGFLKHRTTVEAGAFVGSNTALVAPVTVGAGAMVGAGSVITKNIAPDDIAIARAPQKALPGAAAQFRARKKRIKEGGT